MKKRRLLVLLLALMMIVTFAACGSNGDAGDNGDNGDAGDNGDNGDNGAVETNVVEDAAMAYFAEMPDDVYKIAQDAFVEKVKAGEDMVVLDIRQPDVYGEGHIKGAVNVPWGADIAANLSKIPSGKTVYVYCYTGQTAGQAVATLNVAGFDAKSVNLGWNLGISKVEGVADVTVTEAATLDGNTTIDPDIQAAMDEYYNGLADVAGTTYANYKISEDDAKAALDAKDESVVFLSIRKAEDFAKGHIETATNIPFGKGMQESFNTLPMDKTIVVYCYTGQTAGQATAILRLLGYDAVSLNGGMGMEANAPSGWANKGFPVVTE
ncbi:rhodanese-like domain-containing protein [Alkalibacter rhizosphaerae]|uniref:Rhodanese-like domain-containing protein n=1 Tax=Alkalibacter rhizosphaerae TaxID=2815577 RepID=A0A974XGE4_9FIRM|nr:rhodanese-like domain-containing protein [Alkalibacter rhizosphaerae]QSX09389.1 rhodanese-like domain-containing protein [Alkalibacter rhizosphaerae]